MTSKGKLVECLKILGIDLRIETFIERKLIQKIVYLLQVFGVDFGFYYDWYLHGPYSPGLTRILYDIVQSGSFPHKELSGLEIARIDKLKSFLGDQIRSPDRLELLVSIHYLQGRAEAIGASDQEVMKLIKKLKPYYSDKEIEECWQRSIELNKILSFQN